jgi:hypothetical protein
MNKNTVLGLALVAKTLAANAEDLERNFERAPGRVTLGTGFEYSSGDYGSTLGDTNDWYVPFSFGYSHSNWRVKLNVPYLNSTGPGNVISGGGDTRVVIDEDRGTCTRASVGSTIVVDNSGSGSNNSGSGGSNSGSGSGNSGSGSSNSGSGSSNSGSGSSNSGPGSTNSGSGSGGGNDCSVTSTASTITTPFTRTVTRETQSGLGDVTASAVYSFDPFTPAMPYIDVGAKIKFPTADEDDGLGTGAYDYTLNTDLYKPMGKFALLAGVAYTFKGDIDPSTNIPSGVKLDNVVSTYIGAEYRLTDTWLAGVSGDYKEASSPFAEDVKEMSAYATWRASPQLSVTATGGTGFTDATPDYFAGLSLVYGFNSPF